MSNLVCDQGLQNSGKVTSTIAGGLSVLSMAWDNATGTANSFISTHTKLNDRAAATSVQAASFDATFPSISAQTVTHQARMSTAQFNGSTVGRISLHNVASGSVTVSSTSLHGGVDTQSIAKDSTFVLITQIAITYTSA